MTNKEAGIISKYNPMGFSQISFAWYISKEKVTIYSIQKNENNIS